MAVPQANYTTRYLGQLTRVFTTRFVNRFGFMQLYRCVVPTEYYMFQFDEVSTDSETVQTVSETVSETVVNHQSEPPMWDQVFQPQAQDQFIPGCPFPARDNQSEQPQSPEEQLECPDCGFVPGSPFPRRDNQGEQPHSAVEQQECPDCGFVPGCPSPPLRQVHQHEYSDYGFGIKVPYPSRIPDNTIQESPENKKQLQ